MIQGFAVDIYRVKYYGSPVIDAAPLDEDDQEVFILACDFDEVIETLKEHCDDTPVVQSIERIGSSINMYWSDSAIDYCKVIAQERLKTK